MFIVVFLISALFVFAVTMFVLRPSQDDKAVSKRLAAVKTPQGGEKPQSQELDHYLKTLQRGSYGWLEDLLEGTGIPRKLHLMILQADVVTAPGSVLMQCAGSAAGLAITVLLITGSGLFALVAAALAGYAPVGMLSFKRKKRIAAFNNTLADCIDMMGRSLRAGHSLVAAIAIVAEQATGPAKVEFGEVYKKQNYGLPFREALMQMLDRVPSQDLRVLVTGILVQKDTGGNLVEILERILFVIRERMRVQGEIRIHTAQGRMTGIILCLLPIVMLGLINIVNPGYSKVLFTDPFGRKMLYAGVALLFIGWMLIRKIVNGIEV